MFLKKHIILGNDTFFLNKSLGIFLIAHKEQILPIQSLHKNMNMKEGNVSVSPYKRNKLKFLFFPLKT